MCKVWKADENTWRPHFSCFCSICWRAQWGRHWAFLGLLWLRSKNLFSGFVGIRSSTWHLILVHVRAEAPWSWDQHRCNVMAPDPWIVAEAFGHGASNHGGRFLIVAEAAVPCPTSFITFWELFLDFPIADSSSSLQMILWASHSINFFHLNQPSTNESWLIYVVTK